jgi:antirestriction protein
MGGIMSNTTTVPSVYVGTYAKYNDGNIAGAWVDLTEFDDVGQLYDHIKELHKDEMDPEYRFQDFEGFPDTLYSESMGKDELSKLIEWAKLSEQERELVDAYINATGEEFTEDTLQSAEDSHEFTTDNSSTMSTEEQYGYHMHECGVIEIPDNLESYFDFEAFGRDCLYDCYEWDGYVFRN